MAKVSVLTPTYNYGHYLSEAIASVLSQTYTDFELVILDNFSTDNTADVASSFLGDSRVKYYRNERNIGSINNFNEAINRASGEYIQFLFADDLLLPRALETFVRVL